jgi:hypothetical protein
MRDLSNQYELQILVNGSPITEYFHDNNYFVEGRESTEFSIQIKNSSFEDIEAIISLDGLSILDGKQAGNKSSGFVVKAYNSAKLDGWAISNQQAKAFFFTAGSNSYAAKTKKASNIGVIGAMIFRKKQPKMVWRNNLLQTNQTPWNVVTGPRLNQVSASISASASATGAIAFNSASADAENNLGAGWGDTISQTLVNVNFERRDPDNPDSLMAIYYDDRKGLERRGIVLDRSKSYSDPFPAYSSSKFCQPPK